MKFTVILDRTVGRAVYRCHLGMYRLTKGLIGHRTPLGPTLLLTTTGRRSGQARTVPLLYFAKGPVIYVVASNGGRPNFPNWFLNVTANPIVTIQVGPRQFSSIARPLTGDQRDEMWPELVAYYAGWAYYEALTDRPIPVVALARQG